MNLLLDVQKVKVKNTNPWLLTWKTLKLKGEETKTGYEKNINEIVQPTVSL